MKDVVFERLLIWGTGLAIVGITVLMVWSAIVASACLRAGYRDSSLSFGTAYCIKRENQTDVVVPLSEVKR